MNEQIEGVASLRKLGALHADPVLDQLLEQIHGFAQLLREHGTEVAIDSPRAREAWAGLGLEAKEKILRQFTAYHQNCRELYAFGVSLRDNLAFVNHSLKRARLFAKDPIDNLLRNDYMVEAYNLDNIQIFRSINFFDYCNYSILDLLAREWMELYERLSSVTESIFGEISAMLTVKEFRNFETPAHVMKERDANPCGVFRTKGVFCCPLYSGPGVMAGYILAIEVEEIDVLQKDRQKVTFLR